MLAPTTRLTASLAAESGAFDISCALTASETAADSRRSISCVAAFSLMARPSTTKVSEFFSSTPIESMPRSAGWSAKTSTSKASVA